MKEIIEKYVYHSCTNLASLSGKKLNFVLKLCDNVFEKAILDILYKLDTNLRIY